MVERHVYVTTVDNPYDPETEFIPWYIWDMTRGYDTCGYLSRLARTTPQMSDYEVSLEIEQAIDDMIAVDFEGKYQKIVRASLSD